VGFVSSTTGFGAALRRVVGCCGCSATGSRDAAINGARVEAGALALGANSETGPVDRIDGPEKGVVLLVFAEMPFDGGGLIFSAGGSAVGSDVTGAAAGGSVSRVRFFFVPSLASRRSSAVVPLMNCFLLDPGAEPGMGDGGGVGACAGGLLGAGRERDSRNPVTRLERADCLASNSSFSRFNCDSSLSR
jgi:hypothetical protein